MGAAELAYLLVAVSSGMPSRFRKLGGDVSFWKKAAGRCVGKIDVNRVVKNHSNKTTQNTRKTGKQSTKGCITLRNTRAQTGML